MIGYYIWTQYKTECHELEKNFKIQGSETTPTKPESRWVRMNSNANVLLAKKKKLKLSLCLTN
jgi:hypothetical protein